MLIGQVGHVRRNLLTTAEMYLLMFLLPGTDLQLKAGSKIHVPAVRVCAQPIDRS